LNIQFINNLQPVFGDQHGNHITLKELHERESVDEKPITMIAVTRKQFNENNLNRYREYIINELGLTRFYHGFWSDGNNIEFDVLYAIPTDNNKVIQDHLNKHDIINDGLNQVMGLIIYKNGGFKNIENEM